MLIFNPILSNFDFFFQLKCILYCTKSRNHAGIAIYALNIFPITSGDLQGTFQNLQNQFCF